MKIQRAKRFELPDKDFIIPLKVLILLKVPKIDRLEDQVIPPTPAAVPLESAMPPPPEDDGHSPGMLIEASGDAELDKPEEPVFPYLGLP